MDRRNSSKKVMAAGTAAALCAKKKCAIRQLPYNEQRSSLENGNVHLES